MDNDANKSSNKPNDRENAKELTGNPKALQGLDRADTKISKRQSCTGLLAYFYCPGNSLVKIKSFLLTEKPFKPGKKGYFE